MPGLDNVLLIFDELEKSYLLRRPYDADIIKDMAGSFKYVIKKLKIEEKGKKNAG